MGELFVAIGDRKGIKSPLGELAVAVIENAIQCARIRVGGWMGPAEAREARQARREAV